MSEALAPTTGAAFDQPPIADTINERRYALLEAKLQDRSDAKLTGTEISSFLELSAAYGLDPFANEVWLAKTKSGKVLLMVGRDGLRKIAQRNGLLVDGDVIHEADEFSVARRVDGTRTVEHSYAHPSKRGPIVGAWCEVRDHAGVIRGFYVATVAEYKPTNDNTLKYSPWGSQESVMILAAAERQALRQATPLSGLVAEGELDRNDEMASRPLVDVPTALPDDLPERDAVQAVIDAAQEKGHAGLSDVATVAMTLDGQPPEFVAGWLERSWATLHASPDPEPEPSDAEVVPDSEEAQADLALRQVEDAPEGEPDPLWPSDDEGGE